MYVSLEFEIGLFNLHLLCLISQHRSSGDYNSHHWVYY